MNDCTSPPPRMKAAPPGRIAVVALIGTLALLGYAGFLRLDGLAGRDLEYDEIWTFVTAVGPTSLGDILTNVATPNNHTLHTALVRGVVSALGTETWAVRAPAFMAGCLVPLLFAGLAWRLLRHRAAALVAFALVAFDGWQLHYSQTARGYSLQVLLVLVMVLGVVLYEQDHTVTGQERGGWIALAAASGLLALVLLPTSLLFIAPIAGLHLVYLWHRRRTVAAGWRNRRLILGGYAVAGVLAALWLVRGLAGYQAGRAQFGEPLTSVVGLGRFSLNVIGAVCPWWAWLFLALGLLMCARRRPLILAALAIALFVVLSALVTRAGPARVYLPLQLVVYLGVAAVMADVAARLPGRWWGVTLTAAVAVALAGLAAGERQRQTPPRWRTVYEAAEQRLGADAYVVCPATRTLEIAFALQGNTVAPQVAAIARRPTRLAQVGFALAICGADVTLKLEHALPLEPDWRAAPIDPSFAAAGGGGVYDFVPVAGAAAPDGLPAGGPVFLAWLGPLPAAACDEFLTRLESRYPGEWLLLNPFLVRPAAGQPAPTTTVAVGLVARSPRLTIAEMRRWEEAAGGRLQFLQLRPPPVAAPLQPAP